MIHKQGSKGLKNARWAVGLYRWPDKMHPVKTEPGKVYFKHGTCIGVHLTLVDTPQDVHHLVDKLEDFVYSNRSSFK